MTPETLTFHSVDVRAVVLKLKRPVVARIATITDWPLILIDLKTEEGIVGRTYLEPYIVKSMDYLVPALRDMGAMLKGRKLAPAEIYETARKSLHFVGYEGMAMIAVSGIDMTEALHRCHMLDGLGLAWLEEPVVYDNFDGYAQLARELRTPLQIGENFYGPRDLHKALACRACDYVMPDFMRIGGVTGWMRAAAIAGAAGIPMSTHLYPEVGAHAMRVTETAHWLEWQDWADPILQRPYEVRDSHVHIPDVPGVGLDWNEDVVAGNLYEA